ncbi:Crp/Fnr family transcriptional regulator [Xanthobacter sediminis]
MSLGDCLPPAITNASTILTLQAGETLFAQGSAVVGVYEVVSGRVRLTRPSINGQYVSLYVARAGETLAEAALFLGVYHCDAAAVIKSTVRSYPKDLILDEFERNPDFAKTYAVMLSQLLMTTRTRNERLNLHAARDRVWHFLLLNANRDSHCVEVTGPLKDLATDLGLTHEVLYRTLARMVEDGEIERDGSTIRLVDPS